MEGSGPTLACTECGSVVLQDFQFCSKCGSALGDTDLSALQIPPIGRRFAAWVTDIIIIWIGGILLSALGEATVGEWLSPLALAWVPLYRLGSALSLGTTPGKHILGLYMASAPNVPVAADRSQMLGREIMWSIFAVIPILNIIWAIATLADSKKQGWHDKIVGTLVVRKP